MFGHLRGSVAARGGVVVALAVLFSGMVAASSHAAGLPDPGATGGVTGTVTGVTSAVTGVVTPLVPGSPTTPSPSPSTTARPASGDAGSRGAATPTHRSAGSSSAPPTSGSNSVPSASATAKPDSQPVAAVDAIVPGLLGACVRITREVVPLQTTLVVLDRNLIEELEAAGVPLQQLVVPCPANAGSPGDPGGAGSGTSGGGTVTGASNSAVSSLAASLAFTGAAIIPLGLAGLLFLGIGVACARRAQAVSTVSALG